MDIVLAQVHLKTADFEYNYKQITSEIENNDCDLIIFPSINELGEKDLVYDDNFMAEDSAFYKKIADKSYNKFVLIGEILIRDGKIIVSDDGFYNIKNKVIYVDEIFRDDVVCDLYVLAKNKYFVKDSYKSFVESINTNNDFIYVNSIAMADYNIYAGGSFAKNKENKLVAYFPECKSCSAQIDFTKPINFFEKSSPELIYNVITFALKEYCENTGLKKVVLGLSGGIDSALVATLSSLALGSENVLGVMMPSKYSSVGSISDSEELAKNLGIEVITKPINDLFDKFMETNEEKYDLSEENLQARLRALILMFISNRENKLLLTTSNKSELAMGFGTLYGDMAGGLNLICDLTKTNVYKLCEYINRENEIIPQSIIDKAPSAELHPNQKDSDRLPEYAILDDIIEMYLEKKVPYEVMINKYGQNVVDDIIKKIYRAQFKRKQSCLGIRLCEQSFCEGIDIPIMQRFY